MKTVCANCKIEINVKPCRISTQNFCSVECKHKSGRVEITFLNCGKKCQKIAFRSNALFCNQLCKVEYSRIKYTCEKCGKEFTKGKSYQGPARFCSEGCRRKVGCSGKSNCKKCGKEFEWIRSEKQTKPKFCSLKCRGHTGFRPGSQIRISELTKEEKFERLKKSFEKHVIRNENGCWDWKGPVSRGGYGAMSCNRNIGPDRAHRASWVIYKGPIPEGMFVCHNCPNGDNPICSNPKHLYIGTPAQNSSDMIKKNRKCIGSKVPTAKLTEDNVRTIKVLIKQKISYPKIARMFNVGVSTIARISKNISWSHVTIEETQC